jgi:hypothetical protein
MRNVEHFQHTHGKPFTTDDIIEIIGEDGCNEAVQQIPLDTTTIQSITKTNTTRHDISQHVQWISQMEKTNHHFTFPQTFGHVSFTNYHHEPQQHERRNYFRRNTSSINSNRMYYHSTFINDFCNQKMSHVRTMKNRTQFSIGKITRYSTHQQTPCHPYL